VLEPVEESLSVVSVGFRRFLVERCSVEQVVDSWALVEVLDPNGDVLSWSLSSLTLDHL